MTYFEMTHVRGKYIVIIGIFLALGAANAVFAVDLVVGDGQTYTVTGTETYDVVAVEKGGTLIIDGDAFQAPIASYKK